MSAIGLVGERRPLVEPRHGQLSIRRQCQLLSLLRSGYYYQPTAETAENLALMRLIDELHLQYPTYGSPRVTQWLRRKDWRVNRKRVVRLMGIMGLEAIYPKGSTSQPGPGHRIYPYLLRGKQITGPDQVWCADITSIPMSLGFMYLVVIMDWWSRYVLAWKLSNSLEAGFCVEAWQEALKAGTQPPILSNTDQGAQFTCDWYVGAVEQAGVSVSMDGRGRCMDNIFVERLWRTLKYEEIYLKE